MAEKKKILITGITGQIGSYLAEDLLNEGHTVYGMIRRSSTFNTQRIDHLIESDLFNKQLFLNYGDLTDSLSVEETIRNTKPDEIYNLGAMSHVKVSFEIPLITAQVDSLGTLYILEAIRKFCPNSKLYQASTSELLGGLPEEIPTTGYTESSPFHPRSPYGVSKLFAFWAVKNYREAYNLFACNGILFNTESSRRGETFVTRKITKWVGENIHNIIIGNIVKPLELGNLDAIRDWNHVKDSVDGMKIILQQPNATDFIIASGQTHSVREFVEKCFDWCGLKIEWQGKNENEIGIIYDKNHAIKSQVAIKVNPKYYRPSEVHILKGDSTKLRSVGWKPKYSFNDLLNEMMQNDLKIFMNKEEIKSCYKTLYNKEI